MAEDLRKAEVKKRDFLLFAIVLPVAFTSFFLSDFIIGRGSFAFLSTPISIITFFVVLLGFFLYGIWDLRNKAFLKSDWKTIGTGRRAMFSFKIIYWNICTFQSLGNKKQDYLNLVTEEMKKRGFQLTDESPATNIKGSDLIFKYPEGTFFCIRAVSIDEDLRVGFQSTKEMGPSAFLSLFLAILPTLISIYIIRQGVVPWTNVPEWMMFIPVIIYFTFLIGILVLIYRLSILRKFRQEIKPLLGEIGESLGSKQITPFRRIIVKND